MWKKSGLLVNFKVWKFWKMYEKCCYTLLTCSTCNILCCFIYAVIQYIRIFPVVEIKFTSVSSAIISAIS